MTKNLLKSLGLILITACSSSSKVTAAESLPVVSAAQAEVSQEVQWENLLADTELSNWKNVYKYGSAEVKGDEIHLNSTGNWFFLTKKKYRNFIFEGEILMPDVKEYSNSGIIFRAQTKLGKDGKGHAFGYQAEVDPSDRAWSGGLYDQGRRAWLHPVHKIRSKTDADFQKNLSPEWDEKRKVLFKKNTWNKYRIECRGPELKIFLNGELTTHVIDTKDSEGHIGIQHHGSRELKKTGKTINIVKFRNLKIQQLADDVKPTVDIKIVEPVKEKALVNGWQNLLADKTLSNWWNPYKKGQVTLQENGELNLLSNKGLFFLLTKEKYRDFVFEAEVKMPKGKANSGFLFRSQSKKNYAFGYQAEVDPSDRAWSGGFYDQGRRSWLHPTHEKRSHPDADFRKNLSPGWTEARKDLYKQQEWNKYRIECRGSELKITLNGVLTTHVIDTKDPEGYIGVQHHGEKGQLYKFRNIRIKKLAISGDRQLLPKKETMGMKAPKGATQYVSKDANKLISEKTGKPSKWNFDKGVLQVKGGDGHAITTEKYKDFVMHLEFNVNDVEKPRNYEQNGNSGLYIQQRYEVQILNSFGRKLTASDCAGLYKQKAVPFNICRKAGEWQSYDLVFRAARFKDGKKTANAHITLMQNGVLIWDKEDFVSKTGAGKKEGPEAMPIRIQDHGNPVRFRNMWIKAL